MMIRMFERRQNLGTPQRGSCPTLHAIILASLHGSQLCDDCEDFASDDFRLIKSTA